MGLRGLEIAAVAMEDGEQRVNLAEQVLFAGGASERERGGRGLDGVLTGGAEV